MPKTKQKSRNVFFLSLLGTEVWTQGFPHAKQAFYHSSPFCSGYLEMGGLTTICPGWTRISSLLISASQVARITGVSHWCWTWSVFFHNSGNSNLQWRCQQGCFLLEDLKNLSHVWLICPMLSSSFWWWLAFLSLWRYSSNIALLSHVLFSVCVLFFFFCVLRLNPGPCEC
jgi:hypothetical protein